MEQQGVSGKGIAFFGGSFDPPHLGHLAVARAARAALGLDTVLFAPVGAQPLKPMGSMASFADRMAMTSLAISGEPGFEVTQIDAPNEDGSPNYTVDTLLRLRNQLPDGSTLYCLMGADSFLNLKNWHRAAEILFLAPLIVASRPRESMEDLRAALPEGLTVTKPAVVSAVDGGSSPSKFGVENLEVSDAGGRRTPFYLLAGLHEDISASQIRESVRVHGGFGNLGGSGMQGSKADLVPARVLDYIQEHGLYR